MILEVLFGSMYMVTAAVAVWSLVQLKGFLVNTPSIADEMSLDRFKALARTQMYLTIAVMVVMVIGIVLGIALIVRHGGIGVAVVILTNMLFLLLGIYHKRVETRTRTLNASSEILGREYREICQTWVKKALPDF
jgi:hypothetical protein